MQGTVKLEQLSSNSPTLVAARLDTLELRMLLGAPDISFIIDLGLMSHDTKIFNVTTKLSLKHEQSQPDILRAPQDEC